MKRDMELIRLLLMLHESGEKPVGLEGYSDREQLYNLVLMDEAGLIVAEFVGGNPECPEGATVWRLTWDGHDFLDSIKEDGIWERAKANVLRPGMAWTFQILVEYVKRLAQERVLGGPSPGP